MFSLTKPEIAWLTPDTPANCIGQTLYVTDDGSRTVTLHREPDGGYMHAESSPTVRRIVEPLPMMLYNAPEVLYAWFLHDVQRGEGISDAYFYIRWTEPRQ
jgi:hypothetical protein